MKVTVTGATGTIGRALVAELHGRGDEVTALSRDAERARARDARRRASRRADVGRPEGRARRRSTRCAAATASSTCSASRSPSAGATTPSARSASRACSRTRNLVAALRELAPRSARACSSRSRASAATARRGAAPWTSRVPAGDELRGPACRSPGRPRRARPRSSACASCSTRTGVVLSDSGGALEKMLPFFKLGIGGPVAGGKQYLPWVHLDDVAGRDRVRARHRGRERPAERDRARARRRTREFSKALGRALQRPAFLPVPGVRDQGALRRDGRDRHERGERRADASPGARLRVPPARLEPALRDALG